MYLTQEQIDVLTQNLRRKKIKLELLDADNKIIETLEGQAIGGSITANANNDIRRSGTIEMAIPVVSGGAFLDQLNGYTVEAGGKIWLDKRIKIYVGIENLFSAVRETVWYKLGVFLINQPTRTLDSNNYTLSFQCIDLMAQLTGKRQGKLTGQTTIIEQGYYDDNNVYHKYRMHDALVSIITELAGISRYSIHPIPDVYEYLPYDIKIGVGGTVYDLLKQFTDILSTWQMYFDLDGVFIIEPIPSGENAIVYDLDNQQYISNTTSADFEHVKNQVVIYGRVNNLTYYAENDDIINRGLPFETYQQLEYIESTGTQWINSGVIPEDTGYSAIIDYMPTYLEFNGGVAREAWIFAQYADGRGWRAGFDNVSRDTGNFYLNGGFTYSQMSSPLNVRTIAKSSSNTMTSSEPMAFFGQTENGNVVYLENGHFRLYSAKIYHNGEIIRDFVPCMNKSTNKAGLYDMVSGVFFENSGTGDFSRGPSVAGANVYYQNNGDDGATLVLGYNAIREGNLTIGGTTFGFRSLDIPNARATNKVKIYNDGILMFESDLVKFENSKNSFGTEYATTQIEAGSILPKEVYFIRIYSAHQTKDANGVEVIDITQPIVFEFMGKQSVSYCLVNDNKDSPFYINSNLKSINYYAGLAKSTDGLELGAGYDLYLNEDITNLENGAIITFMPNALNIYKNGKNYTSVNIYSKSGQLLKNDVKIVKNTWEYNNGTPYRPNLEENKLYNDYTIWELKYEIIGDSAQVVLLGRNPSAITSVLSGGEYDNIYADQLAYERCLYELFNASNLNDSISLSVVPNYLIDVNCKIAYYPNDAQPKNVYDTQPYTVAKDESYSQFVTSLGKKFYVRYNELQYYITKQITYPLGVDSTPQNVSAIRIYDSGNLVGQGY